MRGLQKFVAIFKAERYSPSWVLRILVVTSAAVVLLIDLYHKLRPSSVGIPIWVFPFVPLIIFSGPISLGLLAFEIVVAFRKGTKKGLLFLDVGVVAIWLVLWFTHL